jgi:hypothetical protein
LAEEDGRREEEEEKDKGVRGGGRVGKKKE